MHLPSLVSSTFVHLESIEQNLTDGDVTKPSTLASLPPHSGQDLFNTFADEHATWWYGQCVETLWRIAMNLPKAHAQWDSLTDKMLVWRAYAGDENSALGEWVRKEVVRNLG